MVRRGSEAIRWDLLVPAVSRHPPGGYLLRFSVDEYGALRSPEVSSYIAQFGAGAMTGSLTNWAGNVTFSAERFHHPASVTQLQRIVAGSERVRALGTGHSFNRIADSPGDLVSVAGLPKVIRIDQGRATVTVSAGLRYGELAGKLNEAGWALRNLGSLPHISIAGACATGTHGSGNANGNLATAVSALHMVTAGGDIVVLSWEHDGDEFAGAVVALGALGIVTSLTLDLVPAFGIRQYVYERLDMDQLTEHLANILASAYSVSLFTRWRDGQISQVWLKRLASAEDCAAPAPPRWLGAKLADGPRHPVPGMPPANCTQQLGVPGPWHERLPHFRLEFPPQHRRNCSRSTSCRASTRSRRWRRSAAFVTGWRRYCRSRRSAPWRRMGCG